jgi:NTE family protein
MADGVILSEDALHRDWTGSGVPVVCFRLRGQGRRRVQRTNRLIPLATYISLLLQTFMNAISREYVQAEHWHSTVVINTGDVSPVDFELSSQQQQELLDTGYNTTLAVLALKRPDIAG